MDTTPRPIRRLIVGSGVALGFCCGGWLALGLLSTQPAANHEAHRYWTALLITVTVIAAMAHSTGWSMRAGYIRQRAEARRYAATYASGYEAGMAAHPDGGADVVELPRTPRRTR